MHRIIIIRVLVSAVTLLSLGFAAGVKAQDTSQVGQYAPVNGVNMYYEIHGTGQPLILIHGGLGTINMLFSDLIPALAKNRQVIAVELQGHGHTADIDRPLSFEFMADDIAALIDYLGFDHADVMGFSLGGGVALQTAIRHPDVVHKLIVVSTPFRQNGWYPEALASMMGMNADVAQAMIGSPIYQLYADVAPKPEDWPVLVTKTGDLLGQDYDWTEGVKGIKVPTLILVGDADKVQLSHAAEMFALLGGGLTDGSITGLPNSQLAVLPGTTHFTILSRTDLLIPLINPFLDAPESK